MAERRGGTTVFEGPEGVKLDLIEGDVGVGLEGFVACRLEQAVDGDMGILEETGIGGGEENERGM